MTRRHKQAEALVPSVTGKQRTQDWLRKLNSGMSERGGFARRTVAFRANGSPQQGRNR
jgi:hypothetical protein